MTREMKDYLVESIANYWLAQKSFEELAQFFLDDTCEYLEEQSGSDLIDIAQGLGIDTGESV